MNLDTANRKVYTPILHSQGHYEEGQRNHLFRQLLKQVLIKVIKSFPNMKL